MATFDAVRRLGRRWPEVHEAPSYHGMPALKVRGEPFCRLWSNDAHRRDDVHDSAVVMVFCDMGEKDAKDSPSSCVRGCEGTKEGRRV